MLGLGKLPVSSRCQLGRRGVWPKVAIQLSSRRGSTESKSSAPSKAAVLLFVVRHIGPMLESTTR